MIKGQPYTRAADIWSAGILLFSMVAGQLPYDDDNVQRLLQKIVYTDVHYPGFMSPPLVDLLRKMLAKNPETRITLDRIKEHHWFSQTEYAALMNANMRERPVTEAGIDKEIVDKMTNLGLDCHHLHQQLLVSEFTELTAIYKMLHKDKLTEQMKDLLQNAQASAKPTQMKFAFAPSGEKGANPIPAPQRMSPFGAAPQPPSPFSKPVMPGQNLARPMFGNRMVSNSPGPSVANSPRMLQVPAPVQIAARRMSRPVALRKTIDVPNRTNSSHEA